MSESNQAPEKLQSSKEFQRLNEQTEDDLKALNGDFDTIYEKTYSDKFSLEERIKFVGNAISCALLAHRGGYPSDKSGIQRLEANVK